MTDLSYVKHEPVSLKGHPDYNEKWLKDRGPKKGQPGRNFSDEDVDHYHRIVVALRETIRIMGEIDEVIEAHGGWPGAFQGAGDLK